MKERPLLMSARDVRAILAGRKTQHRQVVKAPGWEPSSSDYTGRAHVGTSNDPRIGLQAYFEHRETQTWHGVRCPYGQPGTRLWVRETFALEIQVETDQDPPHADGRPVKRVDDPDLGCYWTQPHYKATDQTPELQYIDHEGPHCRWRPSIHMPRWASRITLEVTGVRVERVADISESDAIAEGIERGVGFPGWYRGPLPGDSPGLAESGRNFKTPTAFPRLAYRALWESINGPGSWDANPWVWVLEFKRVGDAA